MILLSSQNKIAYVVFLLHSPRATLIEH